MNAFEEANVKILDINQVLKAAADKKEAVAGIQAFALLEPTKKLLRNVVQVGLDADLTIELIAERLGLDTAAVENLMDEVWLEKSARRARS